jgi:multiple sugar transport system permease protein
VNTLQGLIVPSLFSTLAAFLFRQFYLNFPHELEEAARLDGLGYWGIYRRILMPNSLGIMMSLGIITFIGSWNSFLWPLIIGQSSDWWTVQVVLSTFLTAQTINLPALFMGAAITVLPLLVLFIVAQRYIVEGVATSGLK